MRAPASLIVGYGHRFTWELRLAQGALVLLGGGLAARGVRRFPESIWIVPAVTILIRIALDPVSYGYYYDPALVALLLGGSQLMSHPRVLAGRIAARFPALAVEYRRSPTPSKAA